MRVMTNRFRLFLVFLLLSTSAFAATKKEQIDALLTKYNALRQFNGSALVATRDGVLLKAMVSPISSGRFRTRLTRSFAWAPSRSSSRRWSSCSWWAREKSSSTRR
jgi:hypothetical protein